MEIAGEAVGGLNSQIDSLLFLLEKFVRSSKVAPFFLSEHEKSPISRTLMDFMVELTGIGPATSSLRTRRSPN